MVWVNALIFPYNLIRYNLQIVITFDLKILNFRTEILKSVLKIIPNLQRMPFFYLQVLDLEVRV